MALGGGEHAGGLAIGFAELAGRGAGNQAPGRPRVGHQGGQERIPLTRGQGEQPAQCRKALDGVPRLGAAPLAGKVHQQAGDQRLGLLVPVRLRDLARRVVDECVGEGGGIVGQVGRVRVEGSGRVVAGGGQA